MLTSSMTRSGFSLLKTSIAALPVRGLEDLRHPEVAQEERHELPDVGLVVDEQDAAFEVHL